ncbi:NUDIX hydrolase [halophilic archaeon DL31]|jgi:ADP-ribose pyrophosphatase YjhB (NUDIX family)|nr:NUDIX hydrolase [halophilic archaeon DL31]
MDRTDPRDHYDLHEHYSEHEVAPEQFTDYQGGEVYQSGWVTIAAVLNDDDRMLLVYDENMDAWDVPGGTIFESETLSEGVVREVREEAGVDIVPDRPHSFVEVVTTDGERTMGFNVVGFAAEAQSTTVGTDLGVEDESISEAAWFTELPENLYQREHAVELLARTRAEQA